MKVIKEWPRQEEKANLKLLVDSVNIINRDFPREVQHAGELGEAQVTKLAKQLEAKIWIVRNRVVEMEARLGTGTANGGLTAVA